MEFYVCIHKNTLFYFLFQEEIKVLVLEVMPHFRTVILFERIGSFDIPFVLRVLNHLCGSGPVSGCSQSEAGVPNPSRAGQEVPW